MKEMVIGITVAVCLTIIFIVASLTMPEFSKLFWTIVVVIAGLAGRYIPPAAVQIKNRITRRLRR